MTITFHPAATIDLDERLDYIAARSGSMVAEGQLSRFHAGLEAIEAFPRSARFDASTSCYEAWVPGTRWIVFYQFIEADTSVRVLAVIDHVQNTDDQKRRLVVPRL